VRTSSRAGRWAGFLPDPSHGEGANGRTEDRQLRAARADKTYDKRLLRFTAPDLLIVDDLGLRPLDGDEPIDLYEVIRQRYERGAMVITSNRALEEWHPLFLDALLASAAMDRLLHHAHVVVMQGHSYRNPPESRRKSA
jgi:DNA replication protein DnaC